MSAKETSVKKQVLVYLIVPLFLAFLALRALDYVEGRAQAIELAKTGVFEKSQALANRVDALVINASTVATTTAVALSTHVDWSEKDLYETLRRNVAENPLIYGAAIAFEPGVYKGRKLFSPYAYKSGSHVSAIDIGKESYDYTLPQWEWYVRPKELKKPVWTEPYFDEGAGNIMMVTYSVPFYRNGRLAGITTIDLDLSRLAELANISGEPNTRFYILSKGRHFIFHPDPAWLGKPLESNTADFSATIIARLSQSLAGKVPDVQEISGMPEGRIWISTVPIKASGWDFVIKVDALAQMRKVEDLLGHMILRTGFLLVIATAALMMFVSRILEPISLLAKAARDVSAGKPFALSIPENHNEIGVLANNITVMTERLQERERSLVSLNEALNEAKADLEQHVSERTRELQQAMASLQLAGLVYKSSSEGMLVTDEQNRIIAINPAFVEITGYSEADVLGKDPRMLSSGRQDEAFYLTMWQSLNATGHWKGEIWNRRKNGEEYIEWLSIDTIHGEDGGVHRRVALFSDITEKKKAETLIWNQANFDHLTQLPNRRLFYDRLEQDMRKTHRDGLHTALLFIDLDRFKEVNDALGHDIGDQLIIEVAERLKYCVRDYDTLARLGGDEFTVILSELPGSADAGRIAGMIIERLSMPFAIDNHEVFITASIGIAMYPDDAMTVSDLIKHADQAMYEAKGEGRNRFHFFTGELQRKAESRMVLAAELRTALRQQQFQVYFQPIICLQTGRIQKAEALLRWNHPQHGFISPGAFIAVAEEIGIINEIGDWVISQVLDQARRIVELPVENFQISVNTSPVQFASGEDNDLRWIERIQAAGLHGNAIVFEITEGLLMSSKPNVTEKLLRFSQAGIQVAIDDFGTGYSSLSYLKKFDIDYLKIDQAFVRNLAANNEDMALCEAIVVMAHKLGLKVIAEGVETTLQRDLLGQIGCDFGQGYLYSRPIASDDLERLLLTQPSLVSELL